MYVLRIRILGVFCQAYMFFFVIHYTVIGASGLRFRLRLRLQILRFLKPTYFSSVQFIASFSRSQSWFHNVGIIPPPPPPPLRRALLL